MNIETNTRLYEYEKHEWRDICKAIKPDMTEEEFEQKWEEFCRLKALKGMQ